MKIRSLVALLILASVLVPSLAGCSSGPEFAEGLFGTVFEDLNHNGIRDEGEPGIRNIVVSNGGISRLTGKDGSYNLPAEGSFLFVTIPRDYRPTGQWYARLSSPNLDFGLKRAPDKDSSSFTFVQMTDIHLDERRVSDFAAVVTEVNRIAPQFVVVTGDLISEGNAASREEAENWFDLYQETIALADAPVFHAIGNHDIVGILDVEDVPLGQVLGKGIFEDYFGPTYYSFDWGGHHCLVLDPNDFHEGELSYGISSTQLGWLKENLAFRKGMPLLVFYHVPTTAWENRTEVLKIIQEHRSYLFCGHSHMDLLMDTEGLPEQVTGALCGQWWFGDNPDGQPPGYRVVSVTKDSLDSLYKGTGAARIIDFDLANPVVSGQVGLRVRIYSEHGPSSEVSYRVGDGSWMTMDVTSAGPWLVASATWDASSLAQGYYTVTVKAQDAEGSFAGIREVKVSASDVVPIDELFTHFSTYQGCYVMLEGTVTNYLVGPSVTLGVPAGIGVYQISDAAKTRTMVLAMECMSPSLPKNLLYKVIRVKVVPIRLTMELLESSREYEQYYSVIGSYMAYLPDNFFEKDETGKEIVAIRGPRLMSGADVEVVR